MTATKLSSPWKWRPQRAAWHSSLTEKIDEWQPAESLSLDAESIKRQLTEANSRQEAWLLHPCLNSLTLGGDNRKTQRDFQAAVWTAVHSPDLAGSVTTPHPLHIWSTMGSYVTPPGRYDLRDLADSVTSTEWSYSISLDVWCHSVGFALPGTWAELGNLSENDEKQLKQEVTNSLQTLLLATKRFPGCIEWVSDITSVIIPLRSEGDSYFRSGSQKEIPGMIYADSFGGLIQLMEAIVHESAHGHLFMAETASPLVDPNHQGRYASPLRPEPRPLRGILLAYHAIAYICVFYREAIAQDLGSRSNCTAELERMQEKMAEAETVLEDNSRYLTPSGLEFFSRTKQVARYE